MNYFQNMSYAPVEWVPVPLQCVHTDLSLLRYVWVKDLGQEDSFWGTFWEVIWDLKNYLVQAFLIRSGVYG